jgi:dolichol kinase
MIMTAPHSTELDRLVERTRGAQPLRRLFHAANGSLVAAALVWLDLSRETAVAVLAAVLVTLLVLDAVRLRVPRANAAFFSAFEHLASPREAEGVASSTWYCLGILLAVAFFPRPEAVSGILVLALADPAASWVGRRWGKIPFLGGTAEGSVTFLAVALLVLLVRHAPLLAVPAALVGTLLERRSWPLDDNLTLPPVVAAALLLMGLIP